MSRTIVEMTVSLDGYATGNNVDVDHPFGHSGPQLHRWLDSTEPADTQAAQSFFEGTGAFVMGRTTYEVGIDKWGEDGAFGRPCFVVTRRAHEPVRRGPTTFTFVTDGVVSALKQAQSVAKDQAVVIMGGPSVGQQVLAAGLADELRLHIRPVLLGSGKRLFEDIPPTSMDLRTTRVTHSPLAAHLTLTAVSRAGESPS
jgi:dihydrofolate reductase